MRSIGTRPLVADSLVYFVASDTHIATAVDKANGSARWRTTLPVSRPDRGGFGLALVNGVLVVGDSDLFGLDPVTGAIRWHFLPSVGSQPCFAEFVTDNATVYCGSGWTGHAYGIDAATGQERWVTKITPDTQVSVHSPVLVDNVVYVGYTNIQVPPGPNPSGRTTGGVVAMDANTGRIRWQVALPKIDSARSSMTRGVAVAAGLVIAAPNEGTVYALDIATGAVRDSIPKSQLERLPGDASRGGDFKRWAVSGDTLVIASPALISLAAFLIPSMKRLWLRDLFRTGIGSPFEAFIYDGLVYVPSATRFSIWRLRDGRLVYREVAEGETAFLSTPAFEGDRFFVGAGGNAVAYRWP